MQRFVYVIEGVAPWANSGQANSSISPLEFRSEFARTRALARAVIEKPFQPLEGVAAPELFTADEDEIASKPFMDDPDLQMRLLIPEGPRFDFASEYDDV